MNITLLSARDDLVSAVAARLRPRGKDYSRLWVVFPETRPGHYLLKALAEREGSCFIPPVVDSLEGFVNRLYEEKLKLSGRLIEPLDAVALLFDIHRETPGRLGRGGFFSADAFFPLGLKLFADLEEVSLAGLGPGDLGRVDGLLGESLPAESLGRLQSLGHFHGRFYARLSERGFSSPASRLKAVVELLKPDHLSGAEEIGFAGVFVLTRLERRLLRSVLDWERGRLFLIRAPGWESALEALDIPPETVSGEKEKEENALPPAAPLMIKSPDTHGQIFALNKALEDAWGDPGRLGENRAVILCASETLFPLYRQTLARLPPETYNISLGYPLARTPLFSFFDKLLELVLTRDERGRVYAPHYLRFVLHPYTKNIFFPSPEKRSDLTRILFHAVEEAFAGRRLKSFWSLEEIESDEDVRRTVEERTRTAPGAPDTASFLEHLRGIHDRILRPFREVRNVGGFAAQLIRVLEIIAHRSTARRHPFFQPYAEAAFRQLEGLRTSLFRDIVFEDPGSYIQLFRKVMRSGSVAFAGTPLRGLQVLGFWEARGLPLDDVSLLDMNEKVIPSFGRPDSLLPYPARRALGLPTYEDQERRMAYALEALLRRARTARLFFVENQDKEPSRFVERILWERQKAERRLRPEEFIKSFEYRVDMKPGKPAAVLKTPALAEALREFTFSASALDEYLLCPLRFYYRSVLRLREPEEVAPVLERRDIGTFVHAVLQEFFEPCVGRPLRVRDLEARRLKDVLERRFRDEYGGEEAGSAFLLKRQTGLHLEDFLRRYQIPVLEELRSEKKTLVLLSLETTREAERAFGGRPFRLRIRADRVERRGDAHYVLDYKTGANERRFALKFDKLDLRSRSSWPEAVGSLQLPVYNLVLSRVLNTPPESLVCALLMLGKCVPGREIEFSPFAVHDAPTYLEQLGIMEELIGRLLNEIVDPDEPFRPEGERRDLCPECPYRTLCL